MPCQARPKYREVRRDSSVVIEGLGAAVARLDTRERHSCPSISSQSRPDALSQSRIARILAGENP
ncbi:hypothetical protein G7B40_015990 [Aetokthonos hydrillicola Thurmond2011]|uniref:Uncharacterized protein n=1 Tax=Aetokthonos hydrillicola Thurmond2011 TaxID=2712845 RepID=A0AAP5IA82_9CYAN|nr:hypothetical protein [Aetokthonos hydrillicola]MDR9896053.1 hypothetical protein [Aetokthonos hydrillicola Thurmond2011]